MTGRTAVDVRCYAGSVGLLIDRCLKREEPLGATWLVENDKIATCAHLAVLYADFLDSLKVRFPANREEWGVTNAVFHPEFKLKQAAQAARRSLASSMPALALQDHNLVIFTLTPILPDLSPQLVQTVNDQLSLPPPPRDRGLSGSLSDLDLGLVLQTITNARKEGTLIISDERNRALAKLYCRDGKIMHAHYGPLSNEQAIYQVVSQHILGNFYFQGGKPPDWPVQDAIARPTDMLLIESCRRLDEIPAMLLDLGGDTAIFQQSTQQLDVDKLPAEVRSTAQTIWPFLRGTVQIGKLWQLARLDDYSIFTALRELEKAGQIEAAGEQDPLNRYNSKPLEMAPEMPLAPWDEIDNLTVDAVAGLPRTTSGHLLGSLRPNDPWHLIHTAELPPEAAGSPIFKAGKVIGMHSGQLPPDPGVQSAAQNVYQLLWVEAVFSCLDKQKAVQSGTVAATTTGSTQESMAGCREVARIDCPRCGSSSLDSAKFCKQCGQRLLQDVTLEGGRPRALALVAIAVAFLVILGGAGYFFARTRAPEPNLSALPAAKSELSVEIEKFNEKTHAWEIMPEDHVFQNRDPIRIRFKPAVARFAYVFNRDTSSLSPQLIFPDTKSGDQKYPADRWVTHPSAEGDCVRVGGPPGSDLLIFLLSDTQPNIFGKADETRQAFQTANAIIAKKFSPTGLEVPSNVFGKQVFPGDGKEQIYLTSTKISHHD